MHYGHSKTTMLLGILAILILLSACQPKFLSTPTTTTPTIAAIETPPVVITVTYDEHEIQQRQQEVDQGHFALSISDPAYTAMDYLSNRFSDFGKVEKPPRILKQTKDRVAVVEIESGGKKYIVTLKKLARQDETGVWFVTRIEIMPIGTSHSTKTPPP